MLTLDQFKEARGVLRGVISPIPNLFTVPIFPTCAATKSI